MNYRTRSTLELAGLWALVLVGFALLVALYLAMREDYEAKKSECIEAGGRWVRGSDTLIPDGNGGLLVVPQYRCEPR